MATYRNAAADVLGDPSYKVTGSTPADDALRAAREAAREHAVAAGARTVEPAAEEVEAVDVLVSLAARRGADLGVVGNRGSTAWPGGCSARCRPVCPNARAATS